MSKLRLKDLDKVLPTPKRVLRQNEGRLIITNAPDAAQIAFQVMYNPGWPGWLNVKNALFQSLGNPHLTPPHMLQALSMFCQLMLNPVTGTLTFEMDEVKDVLTLTRTNDAEPGSFLANAVYLYVSLQTRLRWIAFRQRKIEEVFLQVEFTYKLREVHDTLYAFLNNYFTTLNEQVSHCSAEKVLTCLLSLQHASDNLDALYSVCFIFAETQNLLRKKCASYLQEDRLLQCGFLQNMMEQVHTRVQTINDRLDGADQAMFQPFVAAVQRLMNQLMNQLPARVRVEESEEDESVPSSAVPASESGKSEEEKTYTLIVPSDFNANGQDDSIKNLYTVFGYGGIEQDPNFPAHQMNIPCKVCVTGKSGSGKTNAILNFIYRTNPDPKNPFWYKVVVFSGVTIEEPLYLNLHKLYPGVELTTNFNELQAHYKNDDPNKPKLIIFDDFIALPQNVLDLIGTFAVNSRSKNWTAFFISQKFTSIPNRIRTTCNYFIFFRINNKRDLNNEIRSGLLGMTKEDILTFNACYEDATRFKMNFLLVDKEQFGTHLRRNFLGFCDRPKKGNEDTLINFYERFHISPIPKPVSWSNHYIASTARICIVGRSGCGKTNIAANYVLLSSKPEMWRRVVYFNPNSLDNQGLIRSLKKLEGKLELYSNIHDRNLQLNTGDKPDVPKLIIFDDFIDMSPKDQKVVEKYAISSRKFGWTCIFITQKFAGKGGLSLMIRTQCNYFILCPGLSQRDIRLLKSVLDIDADRFESCYKGVTSRAKSFHRGKHENIPSPFLLVDEETDDPLLKIRVGFKQPCLG